MVNFVNNLNNEKKRSLRIIGYALVGLIVISFLYTSPITDSSMENYLLIHTLLGFISVFISFSIFLYGWNTLPHHLSSNRLLISLLFLQVGIFDLFHLLLYQEMPLINNEYAIIQTTTFWMLARMTDSLGLAYIFTRSSKWRFNFDRKYDILTIFLFITFTITSLILFVPQIIPVYILDNGFTPLKTAFQLLVCLLYVTALIVIFKRYKERLDPNLLHIIVALVFLLIGELNFIIFVSVNNWDSLFGHFYNVIGFAYLLKAIYFPQVTEVFEERDEADLKRAKAEQLLKESQQKLTTEILRAQEEERKRVSRDLHDGVGQIFYSIIVKSKMMNYLDPNPDMKKELLELGGLASEGMKEVREIAAELRPSSLDDLGLVPAMRSHMNNFKKIYNLEIQFIADNFNGTITPEIDIALYRIYQEALLNVAKYAEATGVNISLKQINDNKIQLKIKDNGKGFNFEARIGKGIGLYSMKERAEIIGGTFSLETEAGKGTTITVRAPIKKNQIEG